MGEELLLGVYFFQTTGTHSDNSVVNQPRDRGQRGEEITQSVEDADTGRRPLNVLQVLRRVFTAGSNPLLHFSAGGMGSS